MGNLALLSFLVFLIFAFLGKCDSSDPVEEKCGTLPDSPMGWYTSEIEINSSFIIPPNRPKMLCPEGQFLVGYSLLHQEKQGMQGTGDVFAAIFSLGISSTVQGLGHKYDDHGVLNIIPRCGKKDWKHTKETTSIYSTRCQDKLFSSGEALKDVKETPIVYCNPGHVVTAFDYHMQKHQSTSWDDAGITHVKFKCDDDKILDSSIGAKGYDPIESLESSKGFQRCQRNAGICGIESHVELDHIDDNVGLGDMRLFCCPLAQEKDEVQTCIFEEVWKKVFEFSNCKGRDASVTYKYTTGFSSSKETRALRKSDVSLQIGQTIETESTSEAEVPFAAKQSLKIRYEASFTSATSVGKEFQNTKTEIETGEQVFEQTVQVGPNTQLNILQKVIKCGSYEIKTIVVKKSEVEVMGHC